MRDVVYIFKRNGTRGGAIWLLVLSCGHAVARKRRTAKSFSAIARAMFRPFAEAFAPKKVECNYCGSGCARQDPWIFVQALGGGESASME